MPRKKSSRSGKSKIKNRGSNNRPRQTTKNNLLNPNFILPEPGPEDSPGEGKTHPSSTFDRITSLALDYVREQGKKGVQLSFDDAIESEEFKKVIEDLESKDNSPTGKKALALVKTGRRRPEWDWNVGQTPGKD